MAALDTVKVQKIYTENGVTTIGMEERVPMIDFAGMLGPNQGATIVGESTTVVTQTAPEAAPVPFADLTAAANYVNSLRTLLIAARVLK